MEFFHSQMNLFPPDNRGQLRANVPKIDVVITEDAFSHVREEKQRKKRAKISMKD